MLFDKICIDQYMFIIGVCILAALFSVLLYNYKNMTHTIIERNICLPCNGSIDTNIIRNDSVKEYDYDQISDPLKQPSRRVARHEIPPYYFKKMIDLSTSGYPDNFTQIGTLVLTKSNGISDNNNKILRLFGRQTYPNSERYEYYTMVNSGNDSIKIPVYSKNKRELYDGDNVHIRELDGTFIVNMYKYDEPKYYPDIL